MPSLELEAINETADIDLLSLTQCYQARVAIGIDIHGFQYFHWITIELYLQSLLNFQDCTVFQSFRPLGMPTQM